MVQSRSGRSSDQLPASRATLKMTTTLGSQRTNRRASRQQSDGTGVKLTTLHSSKGLEYPLVFLTGLDLLDARPERFADSVRLLYVGMTRATHVLHLTAAAETPMVGHVRAAMERVSLANMPVCDAN